MKNKLTDLNDHLFAQLERLGDKNLTAEKLEREVERSKSIADISKTIISGAALQLKAIELKAEYKGLNTSDLKQLAGIEK